VGPFVPYSDHFRLVDDLVDHLNTVIPGIVDPFIVSRYSGFVAVAAVTVFELAIKDIFCDFGARKHQILGAFTRKFFDRINGRIKYETIHRDYVSKFGDKYVKRFKGKMNKAEKEYFNVCRKSIFASYNNLIVWRNSFAHEGQMPTQATYAEVVDAYSTGKKLVECLAVSMRR
jgi:hypothetical protein